jgi:predicted transglutaminase-like cysteine proteinase
MTTRGLVLSAAALIALCVPAARAQSQPGTTSTTPATAPDKPESIAQRKDNQQDRIAQGVESGQLTPGETKNLETKEAELNKEERNMRTEDNGHLTAADRAKLNNQQNGLSRQIYADKHNAAQDHFGNSEVGQRQENQQDRIAQGIQSGQLTAGETAKLENQQQGINREVNGMRQANGGKLTQADKKAVNQQQNQASRNIYNKKHNAAHTRP